MSASHPKLTLLLSQTASFQQQSPKQAAKEAARDEDEARWTGRMKKLVKAKPEDGGEPS